MIRTFENAFLTNTLKAWKSPWFLELLSRRPNPALEPTVNSISHTLQKRSSHGNLPSPSLGRLIGSYSLLHSPTQTVCSCFSRYCPATSALPLWGLESWKRAIPKAPHGRTDSDLPAQTCLWTTFPYWTPSSECPDLDNCLDIFKKTILEWYREQEFRMNLLFLLGCRRFEPSRFEIDH